MIKASNSLQGRSGPADGRPVPRHIRPPEVVAALSCGLRVFRRTARLSLALAGSVAVLGVVLLALLAGAGLAPMGLPLTGGFLLVAPVLLAGFFGISAAERSGREPALRDLVRGFRQAPRALWGLLAICVFLFVIWMTDAGILYSFMLGRSYTGWTMLFPLSGELMRFHLSAVVAGSLFALIVFCISAYAVPLLIERRANLVVAVSASVRAVFSSLAANAAWGLVLAATVIVSIIVPLLLTATLPIMAYATECLYRSVFPPEQG